MIELTLEQLHAAIPTASMTNVKRFLKPLNDAMVKYDIATTRMRVAHFLAQIAWESGSLRYTEEIASGAAYDTGKLAAALGNTPEKDGDGQRYKGRGLIQLTGRANYRKYGVCIGKDMEDMKEQNWLLLKDPHYAADSAGWFWKTHWLNDMADHDEFTKITKVINGSTASVVKRKPFLRSAKIALGLKVPNLS